MIKFWSHKNIVEFHWIQIHLTSQSFHPTFNRNTAGKPSITPQISHLSMKNKVLIFIISICLFLNSLEPVILKNYPTSSTDWSFRIVIMGALMWAICCIVTITDFAGKGGDFWSGYRFEERFSNECGDFLNYSKSISHIDVYAALY